jgi:hypothetical protein
VKEKLKKFSIKNFYDDKVDFVYIGIIIFLSLIVIAILIGCYFIIKKRKAIFNKNNLKCIQEIMSMLVVYVSLCIPSNIHIFELLLKF